MNRKKEQKRNPITVTMVVEFEVEVDQVEELRAALVEGSPKSVAQTWAKDIREARIEVPGIRQGGPTKKQKCGGGE